MDIIIEKVNGTHDKISKYLESKKPLNDTDKIAFHSMYDHQLIDTSAISFLAIVDEKICGVISFKTATSDKKKYLKLLVFSTDTDKAATLLIDQLLSFFNESQSHYVVTPMIKDRSIEAKALSRFKKYDILYMCRSDIRRNSSFSFVRLSKNNRATYYRKLIDLLIKYDLKLNSDHNEAASEPIYPTSSKNDDRIRVSYFINSVIKNPLWYLFMILDEDEEIVGFVKGLIHPDKSVFIEIQSDKKSFTEAIRFFVNNTPAKFFFAVVSKANVFEKNSFIDNSYKEIGSSYFFS